MATRTASYVDKRAHSPEYGPTEPAAICLDAITSRSPCNGSPGRSTTMVLTMFRMSFAVSGWLMVWRSIDVFTIGVT